MYGPSDAVFKQRKDPPGGPKTGPIGEPRKNAWPALMVPLIGLRITESPFKATGEILRKQALSKKDAVVEERRKRKEGEGEKFCCKSGLERTDCASAGGDKIVWDGDYCGLVLVLGLCGLGLSGALVVKSRRGTAASFLLEVWC